MTTTMVRVQMVKNNRVANLPNGEMRICAEGEVVEIDLAQAEKLAGDGVIDMMAVPGFVPAHKVVNPARAGGGPTTLVEIRRATSIRGHLHEPGEIVEVTEAEALGPVGRGEAYPTTAIRLIPRAGA